MAAATGMTGGLLHMAGDALLGTGGFNDLGDGHPGAYPGLPGRGVTGVTGA